MDFNLSPEARIDLLDIQDYIAQDSPRQAAKVIDDIFAAFQKLSGSPMIGHLRADLTSRNVRFWNVYSYLVIYDATTEPVEIVRVLSGFRDIAALME